MLALLRKPPLILETLHFTVLEVLILLEHNWILLRHIFAHDLQIVTWLVLIDRDVKIGVDDRDLVALVHAEVEGLNVVVVGEDSLNLRLHNDVRDEGR